MKLFRKNSFSACNNTQKIYKILLLYGSYTLKIIINKKMEKNKKNLEIENIMLILDKLIEYCVDDVNDKQCNCNDKYCQNNAMSPGLRAILGKEINKGYQNINKIILLNRTSGVKLYLNESSDHTRIKGYITHQPEIYNDNTLLLKGLSGSLILPKNNPDLDLHIETSIGTIYGEIAHPGLFKVLVRGDINLNLYSPLEVLIKGYGEDVKVQNMEQINYNTYRPNKTSETLPKLNLFSNTGDIKVNYKIEF